MGHQLSSISIFTLLLSLLMASGQAKRLMFAQYFMSATYNYHDKSTFPWVPFEEDIKNAINAKLDGFILNVGYQEWELDHLDRMFEVAEDFGNFKVFVNVNMTYAKNRNGPRLVQILRRNYEKKSQFKIDGRPVFGTYLGHNLRTKGSLKEWWTYNFFNTLQLQNIPVYFMPFWPMSAAKLFGDHPFVDGYQSLEAWPKGRNVTINYQKEKKFIEEAHKANKTVMSAVSPGYFSHFTNNNRIRRSEDTWHLRWDQLINNDADFGQVISWNGFHESHAVGPFNSLSSVRDYYWYEDVCNEAFTKMLPYYVEWFKTRKQPPLTENVIYFYHRPHSLWAPNVSEYDPLPKPPNFEESVDAFVIHSFIKDEGSYDARIYIGGQAMAPIVLEGGKVNHVLVPFNEWYGEVELVVSKNATEVARTPEDDLTEIIGFGLIKKWNFNFNSRVISFPLGLNITTPIGPPADPTTVIFIVTEKSN